MILQETLKAELILATLDLTWTIYPQELHQRLSQRVGFWLVLQLWSCQVVKLLGTTCSLHAKQARQLFLTRFGRIKWSWRLSMWGKKEVRIYGAKSIHDAGQVGGNKNGIVMKGFSKKTSTKLERTASGLWEISNILMILMKQLQAFVEKQVISIETWTYHCCFLQAVTTSKEGKWTSSSFHCWLLPCTKLLCW